ncbi:YggS family pyridoxal phosphate-dependent enzyme [Chitinivorax sp. PXF-14]|uniref:YggS family pyridoxal phosphate-dependent enzyme n=1 Tax=Chitinivorax sp. PXF-14 TaxID=3230488 RepID=UPI0034653FA4
MGTIKTALQAVHQRIAQAATAAGRSPESVRLLAVSKTFPADCVSDAYQAGQLAFGENYVQEAVEKITGLGGLSVAHVGDGGVGRRGAPDAATSELSIAPGSDCHSSAVASPQTGPNETLMLTAEDTTGSSVPTFTVGGTAGSSEPGIEPGSDCHSSAVASPLAGPLLLPLEWHMIGPLQSNKTRLVAEHFDWVHTVERLKTAERLSAQRPAQLAPLQVCIQVNVSGEASKSGCALDEVPALAAAVAGLPRLRLRGLMCIPEPTEDETKLRAQFRTLRECFERLNSSGLALDTLSMGMSADLELAIAEGATIVRIGTAIFGARARPTP